MRRILVRDGVITVIRTTPSGEEYIAAVIPADDKSIEAVIIRLTEFGIYMGDLGLEVLTSHRPLV